MGVAQKGRRAQAPMFAKRPETLNKIAAQKEISQVQVLSFIELHQLSSIRKRYSHLPQHPSDPERDHYIAVNSPIAKSGGLVFFFLFLSGKILSVLPYPDLLFFTKKSNFNEAFTFLPLKYQLARPGGEVLICCSSLVCCCLSSAPIAGELIQRC